MSASRTAGILDGIRRAGGLEAMGLKRGHLGVLIGLAYFENDLTGDCWPSCKRIALLTGYCRGRVSTLRTELERMGYIIEDLDRRQEIYWHERKYWKFNEEVFPRVMQDPKCYTKQVDENTDQDGEMLHEARPGKFEMLHESELNETKGEETNGSEFLHSVPVQQDEDEPGQDDPVYVPVDPAGDGSLTLRHTLEKPPAADHDQPRHPVMLHLLAVLGKVLEIRHPRKAKPWRDYESELVTRLRPDDLKELIPAMDWMLTNHHWFKAFKDPRKKDLVGFFLNNSKRILSDFEVNRAAAMNPPEPSPVELEGSRPPAIRRPPRPAPVPIRILPPTRPLAVKFDALLKERGITFEDTSDWDEVETWMEETYTADQLMAAPAAIEIVLGGEEEYWSPKMFDGRKDNLFWFFANNLARILKSSQVARARAQLKKPAQKEAKDGNEDKPSQWARMGEM